LVAKPIAGSREEIMAFIYAGMADDPMIARDADGKPVGIKGPVGPVGTSDEEAYDEEEAKQRFEAALRAALTAPPKPHKRRVRGP
jgi:hypothetical protein